MIDGCRQSHRKNLPLRAETQPLLMPGARTVGPMINSPGMRSTFPAEGGGVGDTESSVADSALAENERGGAALYRKRLDGFRHQRPGRPEQLLEGLPERDVDIGHRHELAEIDQRGDAVAGIGDAAGHDAGEMR